MTLTAPGCPVAGQIIADVQKRVEAIEEVPRAGSNYFFLASSRNPP